MRAHSVAIVVKRKVKRADGFLSLIETTHLISSASLISINEGLRYFSGTRNMVMLASLSHTRVRIATIIRETEELFTIIFLGIADFLSVSGRE